MNLNIDLPDDLGASLKAKALERGVTLAGFARQVLEEALNPAQDHGLRPKKSGYGLLEKYGPGPSEEEIDENRREMLRGFAEDVP